MIEALVVGRIGVDFTPASPGTSLADADSFIRAVGGFAGNIATGLARLGVSTAAVSGVGDDGHGDHVRRALAAEGVDVGSIVTFAGSRTQVAFFEAWPPEHFPVTFYRLPPSPDTRLTVADVPAQGLDQAPLIIVSGALLAAEPARSMARHVLERRAASRRGRPTSWTILDLDWRPTLWGDPGEYPGLMVEMARLADVLIGSDEEFDAARLRPEAEAGPGRLVVLKHGRLGVSLLTESGRRMVAGIPVDVVCGLGAGDALDAAFAAGLVQGLDPIAAIERGNAAGAIVASRLTCSSSMPTADEIDRLLSRQAREPQQVRP